MTAEALERANALWNQGGQWSDVVAALHNEGFTKIDCIRVGVQLLRVPLAEAKRLVHYSEPWNDVRGSDDALHAVAARAAVEASGQQISAGPTGLARLSHRELAERLVGMVTALRAGDVESARIIVDELLESEDPERMLLLSGGLTASLADMAAIGEENLLQALGILVATVED